MMLGEMRLEGSMYSDKEPTLAGELSPALLDRAVSSLPEGILSGMRKAPRSSASPENAGPDSGGRRGR